MTIFLNVPNKGCQDLRVYILEAVQACTMNVSPDFNFSRYAIQAEGWINALGRGGLNTQHDHPAWVWSGCYYINVPDGDKDLSGNIEFFDTRTNERTLTVDGAAYFVSKFVMKPRAGILLMFPSYLRHWVYPNESEEERVTVAFNARFIKTSRS
ncbi:MAG: 2OG-Fe(II) oxygenase family protein [Methylococcaceae bacterium]